MKWIACAAVLVATSSSAGSMRYLEGVGIPNTQTPGGEIITGTLDWGTPELLEPLEYAIDWGGTPIYGTMTAETILSLDVDLSIVWRDEASGLSLVAISATGPASVDAAEFVATDYGGFETWLLVDVSTEPNRYGSITSIVVPEPLAGIVAAIALVVLVLVGRGRRVPDEWNN